MQQRTSVFPRQLAWYGLQLRQHRRRPLTPRPWQLRPPHRSLVSQTWWSWGGRPPWSPGSRQPSYQQDQL